MRGHLRFVSRVWLFGHRLIYRHCVGKKQHTTWPAAACGMIEADNMLRGRRHRTCWPIRIRGRRHCPHSTVKFMPNRSVDPISTLCNLPTGLLIPSVDRKWQPPMAQQRGLDQHCRGTKFRNPLAPGCICTRYAFRNLKNMKILRKNLKKNWTQTYASNEHSWKISTENNNFYALWKKDKFLLWKHTF